VNAVNTNGLRRSNVGVRGLTPSYGLDRQHEGLDIGEGQWGKSRKGVHLISVQEVTVRIASNGAALVR
jgi:hypothetical protein